MRSRYFMRFNVSKLVLKFIFQVNSFKLIWTHGLLVKWCFALLCSAPALFYSLRMNQIELLFLFITKCTFFGSMVQSAKSLCHRPWFIWLFREIHGENRIFCFLEKNRVCVEYTLRVVQHSVEYTNYAQYQKHRNGSNLRTIVMGDISYRQ